MAVLVLAALQTAWASELQRAMPPKKKPAAKRKAGAAGGASKKAKGGGAAAGAIPVDEHAPAGSTVHGDYSWCA